MLLEMRSDTEDHFLFDTVILGLLTIFKNCQALSPFEAVNSTWPLELSMGCEAPFGNEVETYGFL